MNRVFGSLILAGVWVWSVGRVPACLAAAPPAADLWVATVAVDRYPRLDDSKQLRCCTRDAAAFLERLRQGSALPQDRVVQFDREQFAKCRQPTREHLMQGLTEFLRQPGEQSAVALFFSMHGVQLRGKDGRLRTCLVPTDFDPQRPGETLIDLEWLRDLLLREVRAKTIVVFLDACHSGAVGNLAGEADAAPLSTRSIELVFADPAPPQTGKSIYILTSCAANEASIEEPRHLQQGIFTHWLVNGLDGAADTNADAMISMDELLTFVEHHVPMTAAQLSRRSGRVHSQTPTRVLCGPNHGDVRLFPVPLQSTERALEKLSRLVDSLLRNQAHRFERQGEAPAVGVLEFSALVPGGERELRGPLGSFGKIGREKLEGRLIDLSQRPDGTPGYKVVPAGKWQTHFKNVRLDAIQSGDLPVSESVGSSGVDALLVGSCTRRGHTATDPGPDRLWLELSLIDLRSNARLARLGTTLLIDNELWNLLGGSRDERQPVTTSRPQPPLAPPSAPAAIAVPVSFPNRPAWNAQTEETHPLVADRERMVDIEIWQGLPQQPLVRTPWRTPREGLAPNQLAFETAAGRELTLVIRNRTKELLSVMVQIDGVNQFGRTIGLPSESQYWFLEPENSMVIDQWIDAPAPIPAGSAPPAALQLPGSRLLVTDPPHSVAGQQNYWNQLGEIRVLVYGTKPRFARGQGKAEGAVGIGAGRQQQNTFRVISDKVIDLARPRATNVIRYFATDTE
ncbi:MAG: caspase domain-containing protein [Planctomycetaceae bacterium]